VFRTIVPLEIGSLEPQLLRQCGAKGKALPTVSGATVMFRSVVVWNSFLPLINALSESMRQDSQGHAPPYPQIKLGGKILTLAFESKPKMRL
jgi:hypothetical protein